MFQIVSWGQTISISLSLFKTKVIVAVFDWQLCYHIDLQISAPLSLCVVKLQGERLEINSFGVNPHVAREKMKNKGERWCFKSVKSHLHLSENRGTVST